MNTTPRTDAAVSNGYRFTQDGGVREYVPADFARQLERELIEASRTLWEVAGERDKLKTLLEGAMERSRTNSRLHEAAEADLVVLRAQLAAANALLKEAHSAIKNSVDLICWPGFNEKQVKACYAALNRIAAHLEASK